MGWIFLGIIGLVVIVIVGANIFVNTAPQIGKLPKGEDLARIQQSPNYGTDQFENLQETKMGSFSEMMETMPDFFFGKGKEPTDSLPTKYEEVLADPVDSVAYITWYGHSSFLVEMEGKRILLDPMLTKVPSPLPFGTKRFLNQKPVPLEELTDIDYVIISHDHYDHLDYKSVLSLKDKVDHFYTALGVGSRLKSWGVSTEKISELDWWDETTVDSLTLAACPARHFSGRGFSDRNKTQWASWVIKGKYTNLFFSGDGGYGPHFKDIGGKYGPFDLAMMECGQYNEAWKAIHMMPEESVQAGLDVQGKTLMPIHWGAFALAIHTWRDPIERFTKESERLGASIIHPYIGERFRLGEEYPREDWWKE